MSKQGIRSYTWKATAAGLAIELAVCPTVGVSVCAAETTDTETSADTAQSTATDLQDTAVDAVAVEELYADELAVQDTAAGVTAYETILYSNENTVLYETADLQAAVVMTADQFPDGAPVQVLGITDNGFYQVDVGSIYYIPAYGLAAEGVEAVGLQELDGELVYVLSDGSLLTDGYFEYLYFDEEGHYTSGNETLDLYVNAALDYCTNDAMTQEEKLSAAYAYIRDNFTYLSRDRYDRGSTDWTEESALFMFTNGKGNCYCFASAFLYLARRLGYSSAYPVCGGVGSTNAIHAWVMITMEDGVEYIFDVELEYAHLYRYSPKHHYNLYRITQATAPWRYYFP